MTTTTATLSKPADPPPVAPAVQAYLSGLVWDKTPRLGGRDGRGRRHVSWLTTYLGVPDDPRVRDIGRLWMIQAVARACVPGCVAACTLVLVGAQGVGKTEALRALGGPFFGELGPIRLARDQRTTAAALRDMWIVDATDGVEAAPAFKFFLAREHDVVRLPYARRAADIARSCVFAITTNRLTTEGRRFWPVFVGNVDVPGLRQVRDQLWAEAKALYDAGEPWWPSAKSPLHKL